MRSSVAWRFSLLFPGMLIVIGLQGCVATRDWVTQQITPLKGRVSGMEGRLNQTDAKVERSLKSLANLRLERKLVLDLKRGANFAFDSSVLTDEAKREIDGFLSDLESGLKEARDTIYLVAGHTDSTGSEDYNYKLGRKRAESAARYLITHKKVDPLRVVTASYGESAPLGENTRRQGRHRNRRIEIMVYRETIATK